MKPEKIKKLRTDLGLSVTEAARSVHVSDRTWQRYESGDRVIPEAIIHLFCIQHKLKYPPE